jgi:peptidoglycan/xylan/chitin deacetylase (PgdA/CDA1 family)
MDRRRLKSWLGSALFRTGLYRTFFRDRAVIVVFHRVRDDVPPNPITCSTAQFSAYCDFFARYFDVVSVSELLRRLAAGDDIGGRLAITFDDGYLDNATIAAPELKRRGLPACFFVATDFIGTRRVPWWDAEWRIASEWMDWSNVRSLHADGFEIGGHTLTHADLGTVSGEAARREIGGCRERLERELNAPVRYFSYPYGRKHQITEDNRALVREAGFECCMSAYGGSVRPHDDRFRLLRTSISEWHISALHFAFELALQHR